jgi:hypothetical protein
LAIVDRPTMAAPICTPRMFIVAAKTMAPAAMRLDVVGSAAGS